MFGVFVEVLRGFLLVYERFVVVFLVLGYVGFVEDEVY